MRRGFFIAAFFIIITFPVSAVLAASQHRIISRAEWGADETSLVSSPSSASSREQPSPETNERTEDIPDRVQNCEDAQLRYPDEFRVDHTEEHDASGNVLRWPRKYSREVKLIVIHHTALQVSNDARSPIERMRAIYELHSNGRGWGDIGYHYLIDETGAIYEGRSGGKGVVGGHAYCANVGTAGIALMGDFEVEKPTLEQIQSLQWLTMRLAEMYQMDLRRSVLFHGQILPPVVRHRDLVATICPGFYMSETLSQVRRNVIAGALDASVRFPTLVKKKAERAPAVKISAQSPRRLARAKRLVRTAQRSQGNGKRATLSRPAMFLRDAKPPVTLRSEARGAERLEVRIRLSSHEEGTRSCDSVDIIALRSAYRGEIECLILGERPAIINTLSLEEYLLGLAEEPDTEPFEKQKAFAIAARSYASFYMQPDERKFPGMPYDGDDSPARFQTYGGLAFERKNPQWVRAVRETEGSVLKKAGRIVKAPYFSSSDGRTRSPAEVGWVTFPFAEIFSSKPDPWCRGMTLQGHGVGMSGCGARAQALEGKSAEEILRYYYPTTEIAPLANVPRAAASLP